MVRFIVASLFLASAVGSIADAAKSFRGPVKVSCPSGNNGGSCSNVVELVNNSQQTCLSTSSSTGAPSTYEVTCDSNVLTCSDTCTVTSGGASVTGSTTGGVESIPAIPEMPDMNMPAMPGAENNPFDVAVASSTTSSGGSDGGNCCRVPIGESCPSGFVGDMKIYNQPVGNGTENITPCCLNTVTMSIGLNMLSCTGFVPSGGGGANCEASLLALFPSCKSCIYQCGSDAPECALDFAGSCSPTCFGGSMTTCDIPTSDGNDGNSGVDDDNETSAGVLKIAATAAVAATGVLLLVVL